MSSATVGVSVVFTDLVGSTELATRVGAEQAEALRKTHFSILRDALTRFNGVEVKNLGDGIMAVFPGVAAAVDAACAMQQGFQRHSRRHPDRALRIRVGIAAGDCTE
ncbi:MAG: adenylate/guanylate cyclase domain-containing protein, partial [Actinomycetota bacterium]